MRNVLTCVWAELWPAPVLRIESFRSKTSTSTSTSTTSKFVAGNSYSLCLICGFRSWERVQTESGRKWNLSKPNFNMAEYFDCICVLYAEDVLEDEEFIPLLEEITRPALELPYVLVIVMTLGGTRDRPGSFVKEHLTHQRQFVILRFPSGGKFAITADVEILVLFLQKLHRWSEGRPWLKWVTRN